MSELLPTGCKDHPKTASPIHLHPDGRLMPATAPNLAIWRFILAFLVAVLADIMLTMASPFVALELPLDIFVALVLCGILGFNWIFLPTMLVEAVPGLGMFPTWTLAVLALTGIKWSQK